MWLMKSNHIAKDKFDSSKVDLIMNELYPGEGLDVFDPWYGGEDGYHEVYDMINAAWCNHKQH